MPPNAPLHRLGVAKAAAGCRQPASPDIRAGFAACWKEYPAVATGDTCAIVQAASPLAWGSEPGAMGLAGGTGRCRDACGRPRCGPACGAPHAAAPSPRAAARRVRGGRPPPSSTPRGRPWHRARPVSSAARCGRRCRRPGPSRGDSGHAASVERLARHLGQRDAPHLATGRRVRQHHDVLAQPQDACRRKEPHPATDLGARHCRPAGCACHLPGTCRLTGRARWRGRCASACPSPPRATSSAALRPPAALVRPGPAAPATQGALAGQVLLLESRCLYPGRPRLACRQAGGTMCRRGKGTCPARRASRPVPR